MTRAALGGILPDAYCPQALARNLAEPLRDHRQQAFGVVDEAAHLQEGVDLAGEAFQPHRHAGLGQPFGIGLAFVQQRVALAGDQQRRCQPACSLVKGGPSGRFTLSS